MGAVNVGLVLCVSKRTKLLFISSRRIAAKAGNKFPKRKPRRSLDRLPYCKGASGGFKQRKMKNTTDNLRIKAPLRESDDFSVSEDKIPPTIVI